MVQMSPEGFIDTEKFSSALRRKGIDVATQRVLVTHFQGSQQEGDLTLPTNCGGFGRIHHFRRYQGEGWPLNPLPIDPALHTLRLPEADAIDVQVFQNAI